MSRSKNATPIASLEIGAKSRKTLVYEELMEVPKNFFAVSAFAAKIVMRS